MATFENLIVWVRGEEITFYSAGRSEVWKKSLIQLFDYLGADGWELCASTVAVLPPYQHAFGTTGGAFVEHDYYFKRQVAPN